MQALQVGARRRVKSLAAVLRNPPVFTPGHYYSPITSATDRRYAISWRAAEVAGVEMREAAQVALARELAPLMGDQREDSRYTSDPAVNSQFGRTDAATLHAMLRHLRPRRYLEVGSGFSTFVALDTKDSHLDGLNVRCVEPYPQRLRSRLLKGDDVEISSQKVQEIGFETFLELEADDVLFIDSTHVVKPGSDVVYLLLHVLPALKAGVVVHIHDVHWPFEYPQQWLQEGRDWNEVYLVRALLSDSRKWQILLMTSWLMATHPDAIPANLRCSPEHTGSLWLRAVR